MKKSINLLVLFSIVFTFATVHTTEAQFLKKKKVIQKKSVKSKPKKDAIEPYDKVITKEAKSDRGLFTVHTIGNKYFYKIPDSLFNREMLMVSRIAKTATGVDFGGNKTNTQVLRWEKKNKKVLLRVVSHKNGAADSLPIY